MSWAVPPVADEEPARGRRGAPEESAPPPGDGELADALAALRSALTASDLLDGRAVAHDVGEVADACERLDPPGASDLGALRGSVRASLDALAHAARAADAGLVRAIAGRAAAAGVDKDDAVTATCRAIIAQVARFRSSHVGTDFHDADEHERWLDELCEHAAPLPGPFSRFARLWERLLDLEEAVGLPDRLRAELERVDESDPRGAFSRLQSSTTGSLQRRAAAGDVEAAARRLDDIAAFVAAGHVALRLDTTSVSAIVNESEELQSALVCCRMVTETATRIVERVRRGDDARRGALRGVSKALRLLGFEDATTRDLHAGRKVTMPATIPRLRLSTAEPTHVDGASSSHASTRIAQWRAFAPQTLPLAFVVLGGLVVLGGGAWLAAALLGGTGDLAPPGGVVLCGVLVVAVSGATAACLHGRAPPAPTPAPRHALPAEAKSDAPSIVPNGKTEKLSPADALRLAEASDSAHSTPRPPSAPHPGVGHRPAPRPFAIISAATAGEGTAPNVQPSQPPSESHKQLHLVPSPAAPTLEADSAAAINASVMHVHAHDARRDAFDTTMNASWRGAMHLDPNTSSVRQRASNPLNVSTQSGLSASGRSVQPEDIMSSRTFVRPPIFSAMAAASASATGTSSVRGDDTARVPVPPAVPQPPPRADGVSRPASWRVRMPPPPV